MDIPKIMGKSIKMFHPIGQLVLANFHQANSHNKFDVGTRLGICQFN